MIEIQDCMYKKGHLEPEYVREKQLRIYAWKSNVGKVHEPKGSQVLTGEIKPF